MNNNLAEVSLKELKEKFPMDARAYQISEALNKAWKGINIMDNEKYEVFLVLLTDI